MKIAKLDASTQLMGMVPMANLPSSGVMFTYAQFADQEVPTGTVDGVNKVFTLANIPNPPASLQLFLGEVQWEGAENDYVLESDTITFNEAPMVGSTPLAWYRY